MAELITGNSYDKAAWGDQMRRIHQRFPEALVIGKFGRMAVYATFGFPVRPISLWRTATELADKRLDPLDPHDLRRDIDLVGAYQLLGYKDHGLGPHGIDQHFDTNLQRNPDDHDDLLLSGATSNGDGTSTHFTIPADIELLRPRLRQLDGVPVHTPAVGVMQVIARIAPTETLPPAHRALYEAAHAEFDTFAASIRESHPEEFLPDAVMAPLVELAERNNLWNGPFF